jgi:phosphatidylserine/phosphatidylglycerophosphate/cardiolipin synthase-like enzyme
MTGAERKAPARICVLEEEMPSRLVALKDPIDSFEERFHLSWYGRPQVRHFRGLVLLNRRASRQGCRLLRDGLAGKNEH